MVSRLLLTAFLAALAVALPVQAEDPAECPLTDPECALGEASRCAFEGLCLEAVEEVPIAGDLAVYIERQACDPWTINTPDGSHPLTQTVILDPEGCIRKALRRAIDDVWPPFVSVSAPDFESPGFSDPVVLSWP